MNSICLSAAPNLRCEGLTRTENIVLLIPPAIELVFSITLALTSASDSGRRHWLLVADGVFFLILALLDFLSHVIPEASSTLIIFKIIDLVIAAASFLPVLAYMLFLFFFARTDLVSFLPSRFRRIIGFALFTTIPFTLTFNELGSLLGITHRTVLVQQKPALVVGFSNAFFQRVSLFFSAATLALLSIFQIVLFCLAFIRLVRAFLDERRVEASNGMSDSQDEVHLFRGLGWLAVGLKLGAVESIVGFANVSFGTALTRRVFRLFGRGALIIGVIKGMNIIEDFEVFESDVRARRSGVRRISNRISRLFISNPRNSTFRELSPQASSFHAAQQEKRAGRLRPSPLALGADSNGSSFQTGGARRKERVTVVYDGKTPPVLQMRFSALDMPVPPLPVAIALPSIIEATEPPQDTANPFASGPYTARGYNESFFQAHAESSKRLRRVSDSARPISVMSDSLEAVREITSRFPGLPPRVLPGKSPLRPPDSADSDAEWRAVSRSRSLQRRYEEQTTAPSSSNLSPESSIKRKPAPRPATPLEPEAQAPSESDMGHSREYEHEPEPEYASVLAHSPVSISMSDGTYSTNTMYTTPTLTRFSTIETAPNTPAGFISPAERPVGRLANRVIAIEDKMAQSRQEDADIEAQFDEHQRERLARLRRELRAPITDSVIEEEESGELPWMRNDPLSSLQTPPGNRGYPRSDVDAEDVGEAEIDEAWRRAGLTRIKTVSRMRVRTTPIVEHSPAARASLFAVEEEDLGLPESYDSPSVIAESPVQHARLDSGVLGEEDRRLVRQGIYI